MDIQVDDKIKFEYKNTRTPRSGTVTKVHDNGRFSVKPDKQGYCLIFRADGTHSNYNILSVERSDESNKTSIVNSVRASIDEHQKTRELIALSSLLLRLGQLMEQHCSDQFDYFFQCENKPDLWISVDHCDEGFEYGLSTDPYGYPSRPLKNVSMLNSLLLYGEES